MYNTQKMKAWIRRAAKDRLLYNAKEHWISDQVGLIVLHRHLTHPSVLHTMSETLNGTEDSKMLFAGELKDKKVPGINLLIDPEKKEQQIIDSGLKFKSLETKKEYRVLYYPDTKEKRIINEQYVELFNNFEDFTLYNQRDQKFTYTPILVMKDGVLCGVIAPNSGKAGKGILDTFEFVCE